MAAGARADAGRPLRHVQQRRRRAERQHESRIANVQRFDGRKHSSGDCHRLPWRAAMIEQTREQIDDRDERRAPHRRAGGHDLRVGEEQDERGERRAAAGQPDRHQRGEEKRRENRDVATGDRDDVIRAGRLQAQTHIVRQAAAIADEDGRDDGGGQLAMPRDAERDGAPDIAAQVRGQFAGDASARDDGDEKTALDRAEQRDAIERGVALEVGHSVVQVPRRATEGDGRLEHSAAPPFQRSRFTR